MKIGFIGVGNMGAPVARNLIRQGHEVAVLDLNKEAVDKVLAAGTTGKAASSAADFADAEIVFTCLPMPHHVIEVSMGENGFHKIVRPGTIHIDLSTIDPGTTTKVREDAESRGMEFIQCTQGKSPSDAEKAQQTLYVGGKPEVLDHLWDSLFTKISIPYRVPAAEDASTIKLITNMMAASIITAISECILVGEKLGMDPKTVVEMCSVTGCNSFQLGVRGPWIAAKDFGCRFGLDLERKDVRLGCEMARAKGLHLHVIEATLDVYNKAHDAGYGNEDCCAVYKVSGTK